MTDIVLNNVPATAEGKAFIRQLRKYLPPEYVIRSRGCLKDRKAAANGDVRRHQLLRQGVPVYLADRLRVYSYEKPGQGLFKKMGRWFFVPFGSYGDPSQAQGPFRTYEAAKLAKRVAEGDNRAR